ncbi:MAG: tetratricopeptide repeat protein [Chloroflexota bacterium]
MPQLETSLLGPFKLSYNGEEITSLRSLRYRALLAYLTVENHLPHQRVALAGLFWPEQPEKKALLNLRQALFRIKQNIPVDAANQTLVEGTRLDVRLNPQFQGWVDLHLFNRELEDTLAHDHSSRYRCAACMPHLHKAVDLVRSDFLDGLYIDDCLAFDEWVLTTREWLRRQTLAALDDLTRFYLLTANFEQAQAFAQRQIQLDSYREKGRQQLIEALARNGQRAEALQQYENWRVYVEAELGVLPEAETQKLAEDIRRSRLAPLPRLTSESIQAAQPTWQLPQIQTSFLDRHQERRQLEQWLTEDNGRLISIVGAGGAGKTRLAIELGQQMTDAFPDGIWFVPLSELANQPSSLLHDLTKAIAKALRFSFESEKSSQEQLFRHLANKRVLLILDNIEHLDMRLCVSYLLALLNRTERLRLLISSRQSLKLQGGKRLLLDGLPVPEVGDEKAAVFDVVQLFAERARAVSPSFSVNATTLPAVIELCGLVDGLPLGIELAAVWCEHFSVDEMVTTIRQDADFLSTDYGDLPSRQQSLRAVFEYSWQLLTPNAQQLLARLAIFQGSFSRAELFQITQASMPQLMELVDKSLLRVTAPGRYGLHTLIRQFASEKLDKIGAKAKRALQQRHATYYIQLLADMQKALYSRTPLNSVAQLRAANENIRLAWLWAVEEQAFLLLQQGFRGLARYYTLTNKYEELIVVVKVAIEAMNAAPKVTAGDPMLGQFLAELWVRLASYHNVLGNYDEAIVAAKRCIEMTESLTLQSAGYLHWGLAHWHRWQLDEAESKLQDALTSIEQVAQEAGFDQQPNRLEVDIRRAFGSLYFRRTEYVQAQEYYEQALLISQRAGHYKVEEVLHSLGAVARNLGQQTNARNYFMQGLDIAQKLGDLRSEATLLNNLGDVAYYLGVFSEAKAHYQQSRQIAQGLGDAIMEVVVTVSLGIVARDTGDFATAQRLLEQGLQLHRQNQFSRGEGWSLLCLGLLHHLTGKQGLARKHIELGKRLFDESNDRIGQLYGLTYMGHIEAAHHARVAAKIAYQQALALGKTMGHDYLLMESHAGLARLALSEGALADAELAIERVYAHWQTHTFNGSYRVGWLLLTLFEGLRRLGDGRAAEVLVQGYQALQARAETVGSPLEQKRFWENIPSQQSMRMLWRESNLAE